MKAKIIYHRDFEDSSAMKKAKEEPVEQIMASLRRDFLPVVQARALEFAMRLEDPSSYPVQGPVLCNAIPLCVRRGRMYVRGYVPKGKRRAVEVFDIVAGDDLLAFCVAAGLETCLTATLDADEPADWIKLAISLPRAFMPRT